MRPTQVVLCLLPLASCIAFPEREPLFDNLEGSGLELSQGLTLEQTFALEPSVAGPPRIGVAPPLPNPHSEGVDPNGAWDGEERRAIRGWGDEMRAQGRIADLVFLPALMIDEGRVSAKQSRFEALQRAAALARLDAVLLLYERSEVEESTNGWSLLDLTIVGAFLAPGHETRAQALCEGVIVDAKSRYVYGYASATTLEAVARTLYAHDPDGVHEATRRAALHEALRDLRVSGGGGDGSASGSP